MARKLWVLHRGGFNAVQLVEGLHLMREVPWSTMTVEQMHATLKMLMRHHPEYGRKTLTGRMMVLLLNRCLPRQTKLEKQLAMALQQERKLRSRNELKAGVEHMYAKLLFEAARGKLEVNPGSLPAGYAKQIIKKHSASFRRTANNAFFLRGLENMMIEHHHAKRQETADCLDEVLAKIERLRNLLQEQQLNSPPMLFSTAAWKPADVDLFGLLLRAADWDEAHVAAKRDAALVTPMPLTRTEIDTLLELELYRPARPPWPQWVRDIALRRSSFRNTALVFDPPGLPAQYWRFNFAHLGTTLVWMNEMERAEPETRGQGVTWEDADEAEQTFARWCFNPCWGDLGRNALDVVPLPNSDGFNVVPGLELHEGMLTSARRCVPFQLFLDLHPPDPPKHQGCRPGGGNGGDGRGGGGGGSGGQKRGDGNGPAGGRGGRGHGGSGGGLRPAPRDRPPQDNDGEESPDDRPEMPPQLPFVVEAAADDVGAEVAISSDEDDADYAVQLAELRADMAADHAVLYEDFRLEVLKSTTEEARRTGDAFKGVMGIYRNQLAKDFLANKGEFQSFKISTADGCSYEDACILVRCWLHKVQYFFNMALVDNHVDRSYEVRPFTAAECATYQEPPELQELLDRNAATRRLVRRGPQIRNLFRPR